MKHTIRYWIPWIILGTAERYPESNYLGAGLFNTVETAGIVGFELTYTGQLIHDAIFAA